MKKLLIIILLLTLAKTVDATTGVISNISHTAKVCHDVSCTNVAPGSINFLPTTGNDAIIDTVTGLSGQIWGNELGWINLHPTGAGVTFSDPSTGILTGKAWSQVSGWINFGVTGQQVTIDMNSGEFAGYAWTGGPFGGWIKFDCMDTSSCVKVSWPGTNQTNSSGGSVSSGSYPDVCRNIEGLQRSIPSGYTVDLNGLCLTAFDACPNLEGDQSSVPKGFTTSAIGACIPDIDYCPNINGVQNSVPDSYVVTQNGNCIKPKIDACKDVPGIQSDKNDCTKEDLCKNINGLQTIIPDGYSSNGNYCYPNVLDLCRNIEGNQSMIPENNVIDAQGNCAPKLIDVCSNLSGNQTRVPTGFFQKDNACFFNTFDSDKIYTKHQIIGFSFISDKLQTPSSNLLLKKVVDVILRPKTDFEVDLVSTGIVAVASIIILIVVIKLIVRLLLK